MKIVLGSNLWLVLLVPLLSSCGSIKEGDFLPDSSSNGPVSADGEIDGYNGLFSPLREKHGEKYLVWPVRMVAPGQIFEARDSASTRKNKESHRYLDHITISTKLESGHKYISIKLDRTSGDIVEIMHANHEKGPLKGQVVNYSEGMIEESRTGMSSAKWFNPFSHMSKYGGPSRSPLNKLVGWHRGYLS